LLWNAPLPQPPATPHFHLPRLWHITLSGSHSALVRSLSSPSWSSCDLEQGTAPLGLYPPPGKTRSAQISPDPTRSLGKRPPMSLISKASRARSGCDGYRWLSLPNFNTPSHNHARCRSAFCRPGRGPRFLLVFPSFLPSFVFLLIFCSVEDGAQSV
jgi:hypothetical protein